MPAGPGVSRTQVNRTQVNGAADALLNPRSVVLVGASERSRWSQTVFGNLVQGGFAGAVHLVNPRGGTVHGRTAAVSCAALGAVADLGIIMVPGPATLDALRDLGSCGARSAIILTSGFAELGEAGSAAQHDLVSAAHQAGIRLLGPNSLGYINFVTGAHAWTTPVRAPSQAAGVAIVSQSGATAHFLATLAHQWDVGLSHVVSTGNEADLGVTDFANAVLVDPAVHAIALFIETVRDPAAFITLAEQALAIRKPLVVLKTGVGEVSAQSALAHTGALVGDDRVFDGICQQYGVIRVRCIEDLLATADIAARTGPLRQGGLGVVSNSGGICEVAADTAEARGITLPAPDPAALAALQATIPGFATAHNPLDLTGAITPDQCGAVMGIMAAQPDFAALLCPYYAVPTEAEDMSERLTALHRALAHGLRAAPVPGFVVSYTSTYQSALSRQIVAEAGMPYLACGMDRALTGLGGVFAWSGRLRQAPGEPRGPPRHESARPHSEYEALQALARHGVPVVPATLAQDEEAAVAAARALDGRVVVKIASPSIAHKSDIGAVVLNVQGDAAVRAAYRRVSAAASGVPGAVIEGVLVAPMRAPGVELYVGVTRDPQWGLVLAAGLGGVFVEVLQDVALRRLPVSPAEVLRMLAGLRGAKLLAGARGLPAADLDAVARAVAAIGDAALAFGPDLAALDVNPLWVRGGQVEALDALCIWQHG